MRILHTSDWHLGQHFMGKTRQREHEAFIEWLLVQYGTQQADAIIIAGDVFDTGTPPSYARELYNRFIVALHDLGGQLLVLGGNHDSVATLAESAPLLRYLSTTVMPAVLDDAAEQIVTMKRRDGTPGAIVCAMPFIRPRDVLQSQAGQSASDKQQALQDAIAAQYHAVYQAALAKRETLGSALPIIATGHLTTVGASSSESVREIYVGTLDAFPLSAFPPADYIALGHLHKSQKVGGCEHVRYSGSPIALSFDEANQQKEVLLVELDNSGLHAVTALPVPCFQRLQSVSGSLARLSLSLPTLAASSCDTLWLEVRVQEDDYLSDLHERIQKIIEGLPLEVLRIRRERTTAVQSLQSATRESLDELSPQEVFNRRLALETLEPTLAAALQARYADVLAKVKEEGDTCAS